MLAVLLLAAAGALGLGVARRLAPSASALEHAALALASLLMTAPLAVALATVLVGAGAAPPAAIGALAIGGGVLRRARGPADGLPALGGWLSWAALTAVIAFASHGILHAEEPGLYAHDAGAVTTRVTIVSRLAVGGVDLRAPVIAAAPAREPILADALAAVLVRDGWSRGLALALTAGLALVSGLVLAGCAIARRAGPRAATAAVWLIALGGALVEPGVGAALPAIALAWSALHARGRRRLLAAPVIAVALWLDAADTALALGLVAAATLVALGLAARGRALRTIAAALTAIALLAGAASTARGLSRHELVAPTYEALQAAALARVLPAGAVVLTSGEPRHVVPLLTGRAVVPRLGGKAGRARERDRVQIFAMGPAAPALIARLGVTHVMVGPDETRRFAIDLRRLRARYPVVFTAEGLEVFDVREAAP